MTKLDTSSGIRDHSVFRIKSARKTIPWRNAIDIPKEALFYRHKEVTFGLFDPIVPMDDGLLMHMNNEDEVVHSTIAWQDLFDYEWSHDRIRWNPCTIEVE